jgi:hypothetical protein
MHQIATPQKLTKAVLQNRWCLLYRDFFSVQLSPYKIEFGHVCEDPHSWEQRYEKKDYKNHRDMGKVQKFILSPSSVSNFCSFFLCRASLGLAEGIGTYLPRMNSTKDTGRAAIATSRRDTNGPGQLRDCSLLKYASYAFHLKPLSCWHREFKQF